MDNQVEALEFHISTKSAVTDIPLIDLQLKNELLICCIVRGNHIITPTGRDSIQVDDTVIVVTTHKGLRDIQDIMKNPVR